MAISRNNKRSMRSRARGKRPAPWRVLAVLGLLAATLMLQPQPASAAGETLTALIAQTDGTPTFDAVDDSGGVVAGRDSSATNGIVRTNDTLTYKVSLAVNDGPSESPTITFALPQGTELVQLPIFCLAGSSVSPATIAPPTIPVTGTSWTALPSQTVTCVLANRAAATSFDYDFVAKVRPEVPNNTLLAPVTASATSDSVTTPVTTGSVQARVSASPRFDLQKNGAGSGDGNSGPVTQRIENCTDPAHAAYTACQTVLFPVLISALGSGGKGATSLSTPFSFTDNLSPDTFWGAGTTSKPGWSADFAPTIVGCGPTTTLDQFASFHPYGSIPGHTSENSVRNSGTWACTQAGGLANVTITGADTTAYTTPSVNGTLNVAMPTDRGYVVSGFIKIEFPVDAINAIGNEASPGSTEYSLPYTNTYTDFAPVDIAGNTNEPEPLGNNDRAGNSLVLIGSGFDKVFTGEPGNPANEGGNGYGSGTLTGPPGSTALGNGTGTVLPGQKIVSALVHNVTSPPGFESMTHMACDGWDNTKSVLASGFYRGLQPGTVVDPDTGSVSQPAPFGTAGYFQVIPSNGEAVWVSYVSTAPAPVLTIEYAAGGGSAASANSCLTETTGWYATPDAVPGNDPVAAADGVYTGVSRVRYSFTMPSTAAQNSALNVVVSVGLQTLDVPDGAIVPNWASEKEVFSPNGRSLAEMVGDTGFITRLTNYDPSNTAGQLGDRAIAATAVARVNKEVWNPASNPPAFTSGAVPQYASGASVDYRLSPSVTAGIITGATSETSVEDCLAPFQAFSTSSIQGQPGDRLPDVISDGAPVGAGITCPTGRTYLRWDLGPVVIGEVIPPILYTVDVLATAPNGTFTNTAMVTAAGDSSSAGARTDTSQIQIVTPAGIKLEKVALKPVVEVNPAGVTTPRTLDWAISFANIDTANVSNVDLIDRLPAQGLGGTDYMGSLAFISATPTAGTGITIEYTKAASAGINTAPDAATNGAAGATVWCDAPSAGAVVSGNGTAADCPATPAEVTGLRIKRAGNFTSDDLLTVAVKMVPSSNAAGDIYVNRVGGRAQGVTLGVGPIDRPIEIVASSIGDYVWFDLDEDGIQDDGEPAVAGFPVSLTGTDVDGNVVNLTTTTAADGSYLFDGLASGSYVVTFDPAGLTGGRTFTAKAQGTDPTLDSDGDVTTGASDPITLGIDAENLDIDEGIIPGTGSISLSKEIVDPAPFDDLGDDATFPVTVACTGPTGFPDITRDVTIARDGTPTVVDALYVGSSCTVTETGTDGGSASYSPVGAVTVVEGQTPTVTITNTYPDLPKGSLTLTKTIIDPATFDDLGDATTFPVTVDCTGPGAAPAVTQDVTINRDGTPTVVDGLYAGSTCTVTETDTDGGTVTYSPATSVTIGDGTTVTVVVTNTYADFAVGSISLSKAIVDPTTWDTDGDAATFPVTVVCTGPGAAPEVTRDVTINRDGTPTVVSGLYVGSSCTVTETDTDGGTVTYSPASPVVVPAAGDEAIDVLVTNTFPEFPTGALALTKVIVDPAPWDDNGDDPTFPVTVSCTGPTGAPDVARDVTINRDGTPTVVDGLYAGSSCTITETGTDGGSATYSPATPVTIGDDTSVNVTIINTYPDAPVGSISLHKELVDPIPGDDLGDLGLFPVTVTCTGPTGEPDQTIEVLLDRDGAPLTIDGLYVGSTCTLEETDTDGGTAAFAPAATIEVTDTTDVEVTLTNTYPEVSQATTTTTQTTPTSTSINTGTSNPGTGTLPRTGAAILSLVAIGLSLFVGGTILLRTRRRFATR